MEEKKKIDVEKEPEPKISGNGSGVNNNSNSSNRIFDKIFTEMKQELKNSKQSGIIEKKIEPVDKIKVMEEVKLSEEKVVEDNVEIKVNNVEMPNAIQLKENLVDKEENTTFENAGKGKEEVNPTQPAFPLHDDLPQNPSHNIFESEQHNDTVKESKPCLENISEERRVSMNNKQTESK